jgi:glycosyltransferase involved in cell wall biosynthesis
MILAILWRGKGLLIDLCMWVKNGARTLPVVLDRLNSVVPESVINQRLIVDDCSCDNSVDVAETFGWRVVANRGKGISDGANTALSCVETEWFASFEQDVVLAPEWFRAVSKMLGCGVGAASGLRFLPTSSFCFNVDGYLALHNCGDFGKTLDNTFWNTDILKSVGGFPKMKNAFAETVLHYKFNELGLKWLVNYNVKSLHLHGGLCDELRHYYFYGANLPELQKKTPLRVDVVGKLVKSPLSALRMAASMGDPRLIVSYPLYRLAMLGGYLSGSA